MAELSALVLFALTQLIVAAMFAAMLRLVLGGVARGSLRWRRNWSSFAFYGAAALPFLAMNLPAELSITVGVQERELFRASAFVLDLAAAPEPLQLCAAVALSLWFSIALLRLVHTFRAIRAGERLARAARPTASDPLIVETEMAGPKLVGLFRPVILLPRNLGAAERRAALRHELAHLRSRDLGAALRQRLVEDLCWWNPFLRHLGSVLAEHREHACDEAAAGRRLESRAAYARLLIRFGTASNGTVFAAHAAASQVERRIDRLLSAGKPGRAWRAWIVLALILAAIVVGLPRGAGAGVTLIGIASS